MYTTESWFHNLSCIGGNSTLHHFGGRRLGYSHPTDNLTDVWVIDTESVSTFRLHI